MFTGEEVFKKVDELSGGERVRLALCKLFKKRPNVLILDEPTNHMDIVGKETLENMLVAYTGTVIFVSHDRYFINKVADRLIVFEDDAKFYPLTYAEYELLEKERIDQDGQEVKKDNKQTASEKTTGKKTFSTPLKDKSKKERRVKKLEELIAKSESEISVLNASLENPEVYSDYKKVEEIQLNLQKLTEERDGYTDEWLTLCEQLESM